MYSTRYLYIQNIMNEIASSYGTVLYHKLSYYGHTSTRNQRQTMSWKIKERQLARVKRGVQQHDIMEWCIFNTTRTVVNMLIM